MAVIAIGNKRLNVDLITFHTFRAARCGVEGLFVVVVIVVVVVVHATYALKRTASSLSLSSPLILR